MKASQQQLDRGRDVSSPQEARTSVNRGDEDLPAPCHHLTSE